MPSNHLILCCPLLLLPSIFPSIRVFSNESVLRIRWPESWSFSFSISPSNEYSGLIFPCCPRDSQESLVHQFFGAQPSLWSNSPHLYMLLENFPGKSVGVDCHFLLQGIFPTQELNPDLPHCRQMLYHLSHQGSPENTAVYHVVVVA